MVEMRALTGNYRLPDDACEEFQALYRGLTNIEADLRRHIAIESQVLFPKALEHERR